MPTRITETARVPEDVSGRLRRMPVGSVTWRHTFRALRHRNYRLFFWGQLVSLIGTWMQQTAMSWFVYQITNSKLLLGIVAAIGSGPMMLSSIWGGSLADRHPKRSILLATQTAQMICAFFLAAGVWTGFATPSFIVVIAALNGVAMGFDMPARQAFTVEMTSREDLLNAISLNSSIVNGARVVGPSLAGFLIRWIALEWRRGSALARRTGSRCAWVRRLGVGWRRACGCRGTTCSCLRRSRSGAEGWCRRTASIFESTDPPGRERKLFRRTRMTSP